MHLMLAASIIMQIAAGIVAIIYIRKTAHVAWLLVAPTLYFVIFEKFLASHGLVMPLVSPVIVGIIFVLWAGLSIHKTFKGFKQNISQLKSLCDIDRVMLSSLSHKGLLNAIVDKLNATLDTDAAAVLTPVNNNGHKHSLNTFAAFNLSKKFQHYIQTSGNGFVSSVIDTRKPLIISEISDDEDEDFLKTLRAEGFMSYLCAPIIVKNGVPTGVLTLYSKKPRRYTAGEIDFVTAMSSQIAIAIDRTQLIERIQEMSFESVLALVEAIEIRDPYTRGHSTQVAELAVMIGAAMGFSERDLTLLKFAGLLHDVGKIAVPEAILQKKGKLTSEEWEIMRRHPLHSVKIIEPVLNLQPIQDWILYHHERWDGEGGYPLGKKGADIPLQARILAVCDTYSAMIGNRPYRNGLSVEETRKEIERVAETQIDPKIAEIFLNLELDEFDNSNVGNIEKFRKNADVFSEALYAPAQMRVAPRLHFL